MIWQEISICGKSYLIKCFREIADGTKFYASDFEVLWKEKCSVEDVVLRAREQNRRIEYENEVILKTLADTPTEAKLDDGGKLELKYYVNGRPFYFIWFLEKCDQTEYTNIVLTPLLLSTLSLAKQNTELIETIKKKDQEIEQYKLEGATIKRYTLITEKFDEAEFKRRIPFKPIDEFIQFADKKYKNYIESSCESKNQIAGSSSGATTDQKMRNLPKSSPKGKKSSHYRTHLRQLKHLDIPASKVNFYDSDDSGTPSAQSDSEPKVFPKKEPKDSSESLSKASEETTTTTKKMRIVQKKLNL